MQLANCRINPGKLSLPQVNLLSFCTVLSIAKLTYFEAEAFRRLSKCVLLDMSKHVQNTEANLQAGGINFATILVADNP
jgi:hypothetical protein